MKDLLFVIIEHYSIGCYGWRATSECRLMRVAVFEGMGHLSQNFR